MTESSIAADSIAGDGAHVPLVAWYSMRTGASPWSTRKHHLLAMAVRGGRISKIVAETGSPYAVMSVSAWVMFLVHCGVDEDDDVWMGNVPFSVWGTWFLPECEYGLVFLVK